MSKPKATEVEYLFELLDTALCELQGLSWTPDSDRKDAKRLRDYVLQTLKDPTP